MPETTGKILKGTVSRETTGEGMNSQQRAPTSIIGLLASRFFAPFKRQPVYAEPVLPPELARRPRSVFLRHLDCGSCNGCELELVALSNPIYDSERYGIKFEASPRHAGHARADWANDTQSSGGGQTHP